MGKKIMGLTKITDFIKYRRSRILFKY